MSSTGTGCPREMMESLTIPGSIEKPCQGHYVPCWDFLCHSLLSRCRCLDGFHCLGWHRGDECWKTPVLGLLQCHRNMCLLLSKVLVIKAAYFQIPHQLWHVPDSLKKWSSRSRVASNQIILPILWECLNTINKCQHFCTPHQKKTSAENFCQKNSLPWNHFVPRLPTKYL